MAVMSCESCKAFDWFWEKIGRCRDCMAKLTFFSLLAWPAWFYFNAGDPQGIEALIALVFAAFCSGLLGLHLLVWLLTGGKGFHPRR